MKHSYHPSSPLKKRPDRQQVQFTEVFFRILRRLFIGLFLVGGTLLVLIFSLGIIWGDGEKISSKTYLFKIDDKDGQNKENIFAFYDKNTLSLHLYRTKFLPKQSDAQSAANSTSKDRPTEGKPESIWSEQEPTDKELKLARAQLSRDFQVTITDLIHLEVEVVVGDITTTPDAALPVTLAHLLRQQLKLSHVFSKNFWESLGWWWRLQRVRPSQLTVRSFPDQASWERFPLQSVLRLNSQPCSIAVVNTTSTPGLASLIGTALERSGLFVARLTSNVTQTAESLVLSDGTPECREVVELVQTFSPTGAAVVDETAAQRYRARVILLVGQDLDLTADSAVSADSGESSESAKSPEGADRSESLD